MERLLKQIEFLVEVDKLKTILRRNYISDGSKRENDAEHSWFFSLAALVLSEHSNDKIDIHKVVKMAIIHDIVEVYAGDTFLYDEKGRKDQKERETAASEKIFGMLPEDQKENFIGLWNEFEEGASNEAKFAKSIDRLSAVLLNLMSGGKGWKENGVEFERVFEMNSKIAGGSEELWRYVREMLEKNKNSGMFYEK